MNKEAQKFLKQITPLLNEVYGVDFDAGVEKQAAGWGTVVNAGRTLLTRLIPRLGRKTAPVMDDLLVGGGRAVRQGGRDLGRDMMRSGLMAGDDVAAGAAKAAPKAAPKVAPAAAPKAAPAAASAAAPKAAPAAAPKVAPAAAQPFRPILDRAAYLALNTLRPIAGWMGKPVGEALHFIGKLGYGAESKAPTLLMRWGTNWNKGMHRWLKDPAVAIENRAQAAGANVKLLKALGRAARWISKGGVYGGLGALYALRKGNAQENSESDEEPLPLKVLNWPFNNLSPVGVALNYGYKPFEWAGALGAEELATRIPALAAVEAGGDNAALRAEIFNKIDPVLRQKLLEAQEIKDLPWFLRPDEEGLGNDTLEYLNKLEKERYGKGAQSAPTAAPTRANSSGTIILNPDGSPDVGATEQNEADIINAANNVDQFYNYYPS